MPLRGDQLLYPTSRRRQRRGRQVRFRRRSPLFATGPVQLRGIHGVQWRDHRPVCIKTNCYLAPLRSRSCSEVEWMPALHGNPLADELTLSVGDLVQVIQELHVAACVVNEPAVGERRHLQDDEENDSLERWVGTLEPRDDRCLPCKPDLFARSSARTSRLNLWDGAASILGHWLPEALFFVLQVPDNSHVALVNKNLQHLGFGTRWCRFMRSERGELMVIGAMSLYNKQMMQPVLKTAAPIRTSPMPLPLSRGRFPLSSTRRVDQARPS